MSLDFGNIRKRGRAEAQLPIPLDVKPLTAEKVAAASRREEGIKPSALERLTSRHHAIARDIAAGVRTGDVAAKYGLTPSRISILKGDGTFNDLVEFYRARGDAMFDLVHERLAGVAFDALEVIADRITDPDQAAEIDLSELTKLVQMTTDRTGHAPKRVEEKNVNINFGDQLEAARQRARERIIDATAIEVTQDD